jgi:hypothetical protein
VGGQSVSRRRIVETGLFALLSACLVYGTWILPYRFPPQQFVIGASYEVGFNNAVSFLAYVVCVALLSLVAAGALRPPAQRLTTPRQSPAYADAVTGLVILGHVVLFAGLYAYKGRFVFAESLYFQSLLYRMTTGEMPYVNFGFYYGPLMLYPAYWLTGLLGLDLAYGVWFITTYVAGLIFLYVVVRFCLRDPRARAFWFTFLALGLFNPLTGLNETFTRFLFPSIVFLTAAAFYRYGGSTRGWLSAVLLGAAISYSFEVAVLSIAAALLLACVFLAAPYFLQPSRSVHGGVVVPGAAKIVSRAVILLAAAGVFSAGFFLLVDPSGRALREYPAIAMSYSAGAHGVPIYPHLPFIVLAGVTVGALGASLRLALQGGDRIIALAALAYAAIAVMAQRAAFGAAEPSHFAYFGLPVFCLALYLTTEWQAGRQTRLWLGAALLIGIVLPMQYYHFMEFAPFVAQRLQAETQASSEHADGVSPRENLEQNLRDVVRTVGSDRPYMMYEMEYSSLPVYRDFHLRYAGYYTMLINARDPAGIEDVIDDVRRKGAVVVIRKDDLSGPKRIRASSGLVYWLDLLSGAHTAGSDLNELLLQSRARLTAPFLKFVQTEYAPIYDHNGLVAYGPP